MTKDELLLILTLTGTRRLPHLEEEIFLDSVLTATYTNELRVLLEWPASNEFYAPEILYYYAIDMVHERWHAVEPVLETDVYFWEAYKDYFDINEPDIRLRELK